MVVDGSYLIYLYLEYLRTGIVKIKWRTNSTVISRSPALFHFVTCAHALSTLIRLIFYYNTETYILFPTTKFALNGNAKLVKNVFETKVLDK